jgi:hypothetical protein
MALIQMHFACVSRCLLVPIMSSKKNKKGQKKRKKREAPQTNKAAPAPRNDNGERLFAEAMTQLPEQVTSFLMDKHDTGWSGSRGNVRHVARDFSRGFACPNFINR